MDPKDCRNYLRDQHKGAHVVDLLTMKLSSPAWATSTFLKSKDYFVFEYLLNLSFCDSVKELPIKILQKS